MKKTTYILLLSCVLLFSGCSSKESTTEKEPVNNSKVEDTTKEETKNDEPTKITTTLTNGDLFDSVNEIFAVPSVELVEDTVVGTKTLRIPIHVNKGTAIEEYEQFSLAFATIQVELKDKFIEEKLTNIGYSLYVDDEFQSVVVSMGKNSDDYVITETLVLPDKYKQAVKAINQ